MSSLTAMSPLQDRLDAARLLFRAALVFSLAAAAAMGADAVLRAGVPVQAPKTVVGALRLSSLALVPSGRPLRLPGKVRKGVDLRYDFRLSPAAPDPADLLLPKNQPDFSQRKAR